MSLQDKARGMNNEGIPFMDGREKGNVKELNDKIVVVVDYGFIRGSDGQFVVFIIKGDETQFYFGATVMSEKFEQFDLEDKKEIQKFGIPLLLTETLNKKGNRTYQSCEFYPTGYEDAIK